jgi:hypothetical protein
LSGVNLNANMPSSPMAKAGSKEPSGMGNGCLIVLRFEMFCSEDAVSMREKVSAVLRHLSC